MEKDGPTYIEGNLRSSGEEEKGVSRGMKELTKVKVLFGTIFTFRN
jgi:hypothetical protein